jgi:hypothetical protein
MVPGDIRLARPLGAGGIRKRAVDTGGPYGQVRSIEDAVASRGAMVQTSDGLRDRPPVGPAIRLPPFRHRHPLLAVWHRRRERRTLTCRDNDLPASARNPMRARLQT